MTDYRPKPIPWDQVPRRGYVALGCGGICTGYGDDPARTKTASIINREPNPCVVHWTRLAPELQEQMYGKPDL